jgi:hypothetical protein
MSTRQLAYTELLEFGLLAIRNLANAGRIELCEIEADHLHNVPSLIDEANEYRHRHYILSERAWYLDRLKRLGADEYLKSRERHYSYPWSVLASLAGVDLVG